jgi:hypothetical protein
MFRALFSCHARGEGNSQTTDGDAMGHVSVEATARSEASAATVYEVAKDSRRYPEWSMIGSFEHVCSGATERFGVGSRRIYRTWPLRLLEEVTELIPGQRVSYVVVRGMPFRNYRSTIDITPLDSAGSEIRWHSTFDTYLPGSEGGLRAFMQYVLDRTAPALAREAERVELRSAG